MFSDEIVIYEREDLDNDLTLTENDSDLYLNDNRLSIHKNKKINKTSDFEIDIEDYKYSLIDTLSFHLVKNILSYITDSDTYRNTRISCKLFYHYLLNYKTFSCDGNLIKEVYFKNSQPYKINYYSYTYVNNQLRQTSFYKNWIKNGISINYDSLNQVCRKCFYKNNMLNGEFYEYINNQLIFKTCYKDDTITGYSYTFDIIKKTRYDKFYNDGSIKLVKYIYNKKLFSVNFLDGEMSGISYTFCPSYNLVNNILRFKRDKLDGFSLIIEYDRIIQSNFKLGYHHGIQSVFNRDNGLKFIGTYLMGRLSGKYKIFAKNYVEEEGQVDVFGRLNKCITYKNAGEIRSIYPFTNHVMNGFYKEFYNYYYIKVGYTNNLFNGNYIMNHNLTDELHSLKIYNMNNYEYKKIRPDKSVLILEKKFGNISLTIMNLNSGSCKIYNIDSFKYSYEIPALSYI